jgi:hypothetical protein
MRLATMPSKPCALTAFTMSGRLAFNWGDSRTGSLSFGRT